MSNSSPSQNIHSIETCINSILKACAFFKRRAYYKAPTKYDGCMIDLVQHSERSRGFDAQLCPKHFVVLSLSESRSDVNLALGYYLLGHLTSGQSSLPAQIYRLPPGGSHHSAFLDNKIQLQWSCPSFILAHLLSS